MSSGGHHNQQQQRLSRVLFQDEEEEEEDGDEMHDDMMHLMQERVPESSDPSMRQGNLLPSICISSSGSQHLDIDLMNGEDEDEEEDMSFLSHHRNHPYHRTEISGGEVDEPSSPFKLNHLMSEPDEHLTSSPQYLRSVRDLNLLSSGHQRRSSFRSSASHCVHLSLSSSPPQTPKTLTSSAVPYHQRYSSATTSGLRPSTGPVSRGQCARTRLSSSTGSSACQGNHHHRGSSGCRPTKRSLLTPLHANVNYFSPSSQSITNHQSCSNSSLSTSMLNGQTSMKRVRLSDSGLSHSNGTPNGITGCRLNFNDDDDEEVIDNNNDVIRNGATNEDSVGSGSSTTVTGSQQRKVSDGMNHEDETTMTGMVQQQLISETDHLMLSTGSSADGHGLVFEEEDQEEVVEDWISTSELSDPIICSSSEQETSSILLKQNSSKQRLVNGSGDNERLQRSDGGVSGCDSITPGATCRYMEDFVEVEEIGRGTFGTVFKCQHRLDGMMYAIKVSSDPIRGSAREKRALNEVFAGAVLTGEEDSDTETSSLLKCRIIQYYSSWVTDERMYIQSEFCAGGSLAAFLDQCRSVNVTIPRVLAHRILLHVAQGLKYMHGRGLAHMDIKPENIFLTKAIPVQSLTEPEIDNDALHDEDSNEETDLILHSVCFKIGDLGLVTHAQTAAKEVFEGDCRYLAKELLDESIEKNLTKADVYALGMTMVEVMSGRPLPKQDEEWQRLRQGIVSLDRVTYEDRICDLVTRMISVEASERPSASQVVHALRGKTRSQLKRELETSLREKEHLKEQLLLLNSSSDHMNMSMSNADSPPVSACGGCSCGCTHCCVSRDSSSSQL